MLNSNEYLETIVRRLRLHRAILVGALLACFVHIFFGCGSEQVPTNPESVPVEVWGEANVAVQNYFVGRGASENWMAEISVSKIDHDDFCEWRTGTVGVVGCSWQKDVFIYKDADFDWILPHELCHAGSFVLWGDIDANHTRAKDCYPEGTIVGK